MKKPAKENQRLYLKILSGVGFLLVTLCFQNCNNFSTLDASSSGKFLSDANGLISTESTASLMQRLKYKSCMFDSLVYPAVEDFSNYVALLGRSSCESLPRVIETWAQPPDFVAAAATIASITALTQKQYDMGMFIAEAISLNTPYNDDQGQPFDFQAMCLPNTANNWGANTCIPTIDSAEYQRYVTYIVGKALDLGIVNFLFGESGLQDPNETLKTFLPTLRALAAAKGKTAIFGQQPNGNQPAAYLQIFDYVDSPSYVNDDTSQPCLPSITTYCQAVLFNASVISNANAVIVELDWADSDDDIHRYAQKSLADRQTWITNEAQYMQSIGAGLVLPFRIPLGGGSANNCYGVNQWVYSSNDAYGCKDEDFLNAILNGTATATTTVTVAPTTPVAAAPVVAPAAAPAVVVPAAIAAPVATTVTAPSVASALTPVIPGNVIGNIDGVVANGDGSYSVSGWACAQGSSNSINVALYLNAPAGQTDAIGISWFLASNGSEPAVASACQSTGAAYRFSIPLSVAFIQQYGGDSIYIHGISPFGLGNNLLAGSGSFNVPAPPPPVAVPTSQVFYGNGLNLYQDQSIVLPNLTLLQQGDGNLVLSSNGTVLWSAGFSGYNCYATPCHAIFQGDGNFVIYQGSNVLWAAGSNGGTSLVFQESSPHIVIYNSSNQVVWSAGN